MSTHGIDLSIIVPAFNEGGRLAHALPRLVQEIDGDRTEIVLVDDGSDDDTAEVAAGLLAPLAHSEIVRLPVNAGKGGATRVGVGRARGRNIVFMDADMATDPRDLRRLLAALEDVDVAVGSRAHPDSDVRGAPRSRAWMGRVFNVLVRTGGGIGLRDTQCGFKGFHGSAGRVLFHLSRLNGYAFDVELLLLARKLGLAVGEVPVRWTAIPGSHVSMRDPGPMVADVVRTRIRWRGRRPLAAVHARSSPDEAPELAAALQAHLRRVDPVAAWSSGAVAFLPCTDRASVAGVAARLHRLLPGHSVAVRELAPEALVPPRGGALRSALAA